MWSEGATPAYEPELQEWEEGEARVWMGLPKDHALRPGPAELQRNHRLTEGRAVKLGDGNWWTVPTFRFAGGDTNLPFVQKYSRGQTRRVVLPEFEKLWALADDIWAVVIADKIATLPDEALFWFCTAALSVNYRVSAPEVSALGLIAPQQDVVRDIARIAVDADRWEELLADTEKKKGQSHGTGSA